MNLESTSGKLDANSRFRFQTELISGKPGEYIWFADARVSDEHDLKKVIVLVIHSIRHWRKRNRNPSAGSEPCFRSKSQKSNHTKMAVRKWTDRSFKLDSAIANTKKTRKTKSLKTWSYLVGERELLGNWETGSAVAEDSSSRNTRYLSEGRERRDDDDETRDFILNGSFWVSIRKLIMTVTFICVS